jgi:hypothetical protein
MALFGFGMAVRNAEKPREPKKAGWPDLPAQRKTYMGYAAPEIAHPVWHVGYMVFKAGLAELKGASITGGGQIYGHEYQGTFQPVYIANAPGLGAWTGPGQIVAYPASLAYLMGGASGAGS